MRQAENMVGGIGPNLSSRRGEDRNVINRRAVGVDRARTDIFRFNRCVARHRLLHAQVIYLVVFHAKGVVHATCPDRAGHFVIRWREDIFGRKIRIQRGRRCDRLGEKEWACFLQGSGEYCRTPGSYISQIPRESPCRWLRALAMLIPVWGKAEVVWCE